MGRPKRNGKNKSHYKRKESQQTYKSETPDYSEQVIGLLLQFELQEYYSVMSRNPINVIMLRDLLYLTLDDKVTLWLQRVVIIYVSKIIYTPKVNRMYKNSSI